MDIQTFKRALRIDKHGLDDELESQADMYFSAGESWALAISRRDELKEDLSRIDAELYDQIAQAEEKLSDTKIRSRVLIDPIHIEAAKLYNQARAEADTWQVMHEAWRQRGSMIRQLAELYVANYYTTSSISHGSAKAGDVEASKGREALTRRREESNQAPAPRRRSVRTDD